MLVCQYAVTGKIIPVLPAVSRSAAPTPTRHGADAGAAQAGRAAARAARPRHLQVVHNTFICVQNSKLAPAQIRVARVSACGTEAGGAGHRAGQPALQRAGREGLLPRPPRIHTGRMCEYV